MLKYLLKYFKEKFKLLSQIMQVKGRLLKLLAKDLREQ
jgi:hypothetical protein